MNAEQLLIAFFHVAPAISIVVAVSICLPCLLRGLGVYRYQCGIESSPSETTPRRRHTLDSHYHRQLQELGFLPLGYLWERLTFGFGKTHPSVFVHSDQPSQTAVLDVDASGAEVVFMTCFRGPALVTTANTRRLSAVSDDYAGYGVSTRCLKTLSDAHRKHVDSFVAAGHVLSPCDTLENVAETKRWASCHPTARQAFRTTQWLLLYFHLTCLLTVPLLAAIIYLTMGWPLVAVFHIAGWYLLLVGVFYPWLWRRCLRRFFGHLMAGPRDAPEKARQISPGQALQLRRWATIGVVSFAMCVLLRLLLA